MKVFQPKTKNLSGLYETCALPGERLVSFIKDVGQPTFISETNVQRLED